jgi:hypothetical protein
MKRTWFFLLPLILAFGVGCAKKPDDAAISADIQNKFSQDSGLSSRQLTVQSSAGVVTIGGTVDTHAQRDAASRQAASVPGVKEVVNNLQIGDATTATQTSKPPAANAPVASAPSRAGDPSRTGSRKKSHKTEEPEEAASSQAPPDNSDPPPATASNTAPPPAETTPAVTVVPTEPPLPPPAKHLIVDQGTQLTVRLVDSIDSEKNQTGDTFHATLNAPLSSDGEEAIPAGTDIVGHLVEVKSAGKFAGQAGLVLQLDSITTGGRTYNLQTDTYRKDGTSRGKNTAEKVGGGAILGGIIGAIAGGGKGAAIGAAAGAGAGGAVQAASKKQQIKLPSETVLNFTLQAPITVVKAGSSNGDRPKLDSAK